MFSLISFKIQKLILIINAKQIVKVFEIIGCKWFTKVLVNPVGETRWISSAMTLVTDVAFYFVLYTICGIFYDYKLLKSKRKFLLHYDSEWNKSEVIIQFPV